MQSEPEVVEGQELEEFKKIEYWQTHFSENCKISLQYYTVDDKSKLLGVYAKHPEFEETPVIIVAGWFSKITGWTEVTREVSKHTSVLYIETREKMSSILPNQEVDMSVKRMAKDLNQMRHLLPINLEASILLCSSMGGSTMLEYLISQYPPPKKTIMVGPNAQINGPVKFTKFLSYVVPLFGIKVIKVVIKWYLRNFLVNLEEEPEQYEKYCGVLNNIDPWKLKYSARECISYRAWNKLDQIRANVILVGASADRMHKSEQTLRIAELIPNARYVDFSSNKATHSKEMGVFIVEELS